MFYRCPTLHLTSHQWNSFHPDTQTAWNLLSEMVKAIILGLHKDPARCNQIDLGDAGVQVDGDLQVPALLVKQLILLQGILLEPVTLENLDGASSNDFDLDSVLWIKPLLLLGNSLPVANAIAKLHVSGKSSTMAAKLLASDSQTPASAFDLVPQNFNEWCLFVESIGGGSLLLPMPMGRSLLLPMIVSSYMHTLPLPAFISMQVAISQVHLLLLKLVPIYMDLFSCLPVHCHQERPLDINIHCFSIALPCNLHNMVTMLLRFPSAQSSSRHPISSTMCWGGQLSDHPHQQPQVLLWLNGLVGRWMPCYQVHLRPRSIHVKFPARKMGSKASGTMESNPRSFISDHDLITCSLQATYLQHQVHCKTSTMCIMRIWLFRILRKSLSSSMAPMLKQKGAVMIPLNLSVSCQWSHACQLLQSPCLLITTIHFPGSLREKCWVVSWKACWEQWQTRELCPDCCWCHFQA